MKLYKEYSNIGIRKDRNIKLYYCVLVLFYNIGYLILILILINI